MTITVTTDHLKKAFQAYSSNDHCMSCIVAQAMLDATGQRHAVGYMTTSPADEDGSVKFFTNYRTAKELIGAFDEWARRHKEVTPEEQTALVAAIVDQLPCTLMLKESK